MEVLKAINKVQAELAKEGIGKDRKNQAQGYSFRGIDDMYNVLSPLLARHGIVVLPSYSERQVVEREGKNGGALFYTTLRGDFTLRSAEDGSEVKVTTYGEAMDSGDKATNKAMSAALKYAFMQTFTIPTEGDNDADAQTHEVRPAQRTPRPAPKPDTKPSAEQETKCMDWIAALDECDSLDTLKAKFEQAFHEVHALGFPMLDNLLIAAKDRRKAFLAEKAPAVERRAA